MSHGSGIAMMVQMAGPEAFQDPAAHLTFLCCRVGMVSNNYLPASSLEDKTTELST